MKLFRKAQEISKNKWFRIILGIVVFFYVWSNFFRFRTKVKIVFKITALLLCEVVDFKIFHFRISEFSNSGIRELFLSSAVAS